MKEEAIKRIEEQQAKLKAGSAAWVVGEQLKDICRREAKSAELIAQDLQVEEMSLEKAEKEIKKYADAHKTGNFAYVSPQKADEILRKFYGLPKADEKTTTPQSPAATAPLTRGAEGTEAAMVDLSDFL